MRAFHPALLQIMIFFAAASAAEAEERQWIVDASSFGVEMMYGMPESDDILFAIRCDSKAKEIFIGFAHDPLGAKAGHVIELELDSEGGRVMLPAVVSYFDAMEVTLIETPNVTGAGLRPIFTDGVTLAVTVVDGTEEIPLSGMAGDFDALFSACDE
jgi:hypothetical protein